MKKEQIMDFTRRISQSNRGGLVIVIYDIFFAYMEDTKEAHDNGEWENYKTALRNASKTISELISSLDFSYELAGEPDEETLHGVCGGNERGYLRTAYA